MNEKETKFMDMINHFDYEHSSLLFRGLLVISLSSLIIQLYTLINDKLENERNRIKE